MMLYLLLALIDQPAISLPSTIAAKPGRLVQVVAKTDAKIVRWFLSSPADADLIVMESTKSAIFSSVIAGKYRLVAYTAIGDNPSEPAICDITVGDMIVPMPIDPLAGSLQAIYSALSEPAKEDSLAILLDVYRRGRAIVSDPTILDIGAFNAALVASRRAKLDDDKLATLRDRIAAEWAVLGNDSSLAMNAEVRAKILVIMNRIVLALESLK